MLQLHIIVDNGARGNEKVGSRFLLYDHNEM